MEDKYILACVGCGCLTGYGIAAMYLGYDGTIATAVIGGIVGIIAGTIGFVLGKKA